MGERRFPDNRSNVQRSSKLAHRSTPIGQRCIRYKIRTVFMAMIPKPRRAQESAIPPSREQALHGFASNDRSPEYGSRTHVPKPLSKAAPRTCLRRSWRSVAKLAVGDSVEQHRGG